MADFTRRQALGFTGAAGALAACATQDPADITLSQARPAYDGKVDYLHGVASGDPLPTQVILWTRVTPTSGEGSIPMRWEVMKDGEVVSRGGTSAEASRDYCVKVDAGGLEPGTAYTFRFVAETMEGDAESPTGRTKTTTVSGGEAVKFAIVSCSNWQFGYFNVYDALSKIDDLDAIIHLGDYFYEYGIDGYGAETAQALGRLHDPVVETVTLDDYRMRHAQYKSDPSAQAAHAAVPWLCTWDDHESTNNSYRNGAENHNPEQNEGDWTDRKQVAVQAYLEWMPVRDPEPGRARESIYRKFDFGDIASVFCLETRLTGRSDEISWFTEIGGLEPEKIPEAAARTMIRVQDEGRTMLGATQEEWLDESLNASVDAGKSWQVLANQIVMARVRPPNFTETLSPDAVNEFDNTYIRQLVGFSQLGVPLNLDAWDGFPAARDRLYASAASAGANLVTLTGDTHTAWANTLMDKNEAIRGVEFGCTSVTSPGFGVYMPGVEDLGQQFADANPEVEFHDPHGHGATVVTLTMDTVRADYFKVSSIVDGSYEWTLEDSFEANREGEGVSALRRA